MDRASPPFAWGPLAWAAAGLAGLALAGALVDFVPAFRLSDPKIAWACLGIAVLVALRMLVLGQGARVAWLRRRWPIARWLGVPVLTCVLAPLLWMVFVRTLPWAWTRAMGVPAQWHLPVIVDLRPRLGCDGTFWHHRFQAWPRLLCLPAGARDGVVDGPARAELVGHRSVVGFAVSTIRLRPGIDAAAPDMEMEFEYDPTVEVER